MERLIFISTLILSAFCANSHPNNYLFGHRIGNSVLLGEGRPRPNVDKLNFEKFDQTVDHFDPTNTDIFKQVRNITSQIPFLKSIPFFEALFCKRRIFQRW